MSNGGNGGNLHNGQPFPMAAKATAPACRTDS